jgi:glutathione S-transferase
MSTLRLVSFTLCPFVQRAAIVLRAKQVAHDIEFIDLKHKPDWFLALSPLGKVPILQVDDTVLFESQAIAEYLDETHPPAMHPADPLRRAQHRGYIELVSSGLMHTYALFTQAADENAARALAEKVKGVLQLLDHARRGKPYFDGEQLSLVDAAAAPLLQRVAWIEHMFDFGVFSSLPGAAQWCDAVMADDFVRGSTVPDIVDLFRASWEGFLGGVRDAAVERANR